MNTDAATQTAPQATGLLENMKQYMHDISVRLQDSRSLLIDIALYTGVGILIGLFFRKYSTYVALVIAVIIALIMLEQFEAINIVINWPKTYELFGIKAGDAVLSDGFFVALWAWIKANTIISLSAAAGFLIGLKIG